MKPRTRSSRLVRQCIWLLGIGVIVYCFLFLSHTPRVPELDLTRAAQTTRVSPVDTHHSALSLTEKKCRTTFPGLLDSIDDVVAQGAFKLTNKGDRGPLQGRIRDGKVGRVLALAAPGTR